MIAACRFVVSVHKNGCQNNLFAKVLNTSFPPLIKSFSKQ